MFWQKLNIRVGKNGFVFFKKAYHIMPWYIVLEKRENGFVVLAKWIICLGINGFVFGKWLIMTCHCTLFWAKWRQNG